MACRQAACRLLLTDGLDLSSVLRAARLVATLHLDEGLCEGLEWESLAGKVWARKDLPQHSRYFSQAGTPLTTNLT